MSKAKPKKEPTGGSNAKDVPSYLSLQDAAGWRKPLTGIWPEWNDAEVQEAGLRAAKDKPLAKPTPGSPFIHQGGLFDDPEGPCELPGSLVVSSWKRPHELELPPEVVPVVVDPRSVDSFDLFSNNQTPHESELMRWITSQIACLWRMSETNSSSDGKPPLGPNSPVISSNNNAKKQKNSDRPLTALMSPLVVHSWYPWDHIYSTTRTSNGDGRTTLPAYNPAGKYFVKLFWMGCWRKITVDDSLPYNACNKLLLPSTSLLHELWPMLLTKALLKVAALDYQGGLSGSEFGDFSVVHCLTGWLPEVISIKPGDKENVWNLLRRSLVEYKWPDSHPSAAEQCSQSLQPPKETEQKETKSEPKKKEKDLKEAKAAAKEDKKKEKAGKDDKDKAKEQLEEAFTYEKPEVIMFASYQGLPKHQLRISQMSEMADASECLRQNHLSHHYPHPVLISQTRTIPIDPPPPPPKLPAWKLIRPKNPVVMPTAEPAEAPEPDKPIQSLKMTSYFLNYRTRPFSLPSEMIHEEQDDDDDDDDNDEYDGTEYVPCKDDGDLAICATLEEEYQQRLTEAAVAATAAQAATAAAEPLEEAANLDPAMKAGGKGKVDKKKDKKSDKPEGKPGKGAGQPDNAKGRKKSEKETIEVANASGDGSGSVSTGPVSQASAEKCQLEKSFDFWMDFDDMCRCFKTLCVYHKPHTYQYSQKVADFSKVQIQGVVQGSVAKPDKKPNQQATSSGSLPEGKSPHFLIVDSVCPIELVVSLSALSAWNDGTSTKSNLAAVAEAGGAESNLTYQKSAAKESPTAAGKPRDASPPAKQKAAANPAAAGAAAATAAEPLAAATEDTCSVKSFYEKEALQPGLLVAEPFSWKSLVTRKPVLRLRSTNVTTAVVCLPAGRHVLRLTVSVPLCYSLHICSSTSFLMGGEDRVMSELTKESCRFIDLACRMMQAFGNCLQTYGDPDCHQAALDDLWSLHCPQSYVASAKQIGHKNIIKYHKEVYFGALYKVLRKVLADSQLATPEMIFAIKVFNRDCTTKQILCDLPASVNRPGTSTGTTATTIERPAQQTITSTTTKKGVSKKRDADSNRIEYWKTKEVTCEDLQSITTLQRVYRGHLARRILRCYELESEEMIKIQEQLHKLSAAIEQQREEYGLLFYKSLIQLNPYLHPHYPFYMDEWNKISYTDYSGTHAEQPANSWFLLFREIFYVSEEMLCVPHLVAPRVPTARLRVIDNDTCCEIPQVFFKVPPHTYKINKNGYTFICEARTDAEPLPSDRWRLRLISSMSSLPLPLSNDLCSMFFIHELKEYYLPNEDNIICRYHIRSAEQLLATVRLETSSPETQFSLTVLDFDRVIARIQGRGQAVIPAVIFQPDPAQILHEDQLNSSSRTSMRLKSGASQQGSTSSRKQPNPSTSRESTKLSNSGQHNSSRDPMGDTDVDHKYIVEARLVGTGWPLNEAQCDFISSLKAEENENKSNVNKEDDQIETKRSSSATSKQSSVSRSSKERTPTVKPKQMNSDAKLLKDKGKTLPKTSSVVFGPCRAGWTLSIVVDAVKAEMLSMEKDSEREECLRVLKKAWEDAEPGRAAKAHQSRINYLNSRYVKKEVPGEDSLTAEAVCTVAAVNRTDSDEVTGEQTTYKQRKSSDPSVYRPNSTGSAVQEEAIKHPAVTPRKYIEYLPPLDTTPFIRCKTGVMRIKDENDYALEIEAQRNEIARYRAYRQGVEEWRERERILRNFNKTQQLQLIENLQETLDSLRAGLNCPRENYRQKLIQKEDEAKRLAEQRAAAEALLAAEQLGAKGSKKKTPAAGGKDKKKK